MLSGWGAPLPAAYCACLVRRASLAPSNPHSCAPHSWVPARAAPQASRPADAAEQTRLQTQAFEAINEVVRASAADTTPMVVQLIPLVVGKLNETLHMGAAGSVEAAERQSEIQVRGGGAEGEGWRAGCWWLCCRR